MLSSRFTEKLQKMTTRLLQHYCTVVTFEATGETNESGHPTYNRVETTNVRCLFLWSDVNRTTERGNVTEKVPTVYLPYNQEVNTGDLIENIKTRNRNNTLLTSARVLTIDTTAEGGDVLLKVCELEGAEL